MSQHHPGGPAPAGETPDTPVGASQRILSRPVFSQPTPTPDPGTFKIHHPSDSADYKAIDQLNAEHKLFPMPFPAPRGDGAEPRLDLLAVFGGNVTAIANIQTFGQIVFHSLGDCGSVKGPSTEDQVTDKMVADFNETDPKEVPQFALMLGDVIYNFGESQYYYDQFYDPYRNYPAPILAVAGNHDGMVSPLANAITLSAFLRNFCADPAQGFQVNAEAGGLSRTAQIQPGVFFTFEAPFMRILFIYSNTLEDPGVISDPHIGSTQIDFLRAALTRVKQENYAGALIFAHHHPPYVAGGGHGSSTVMRQQMDAVCAEVGVWPHAVLSGHAHNYQRFTRLRPDGTEIPYVVCGNGGHNVVKLSQPGDPILRAPQIVVLAGGGEDQVTLENYDDVDYGYLRVIVDPQQLRIEYHPAADGATVKAADDHVVIDLATRKQAAYVANDLGLPGRARAVRAKYHGD